LSEEEFGAIKTLKRLDNTNPSVGIDEIYDYQATYNKRWGIIQKTVVSDAAVE
jgi:hypothetical protein